MQKESQNFGDILSALICKKCSLIISNDPVSCKKCEKPIFCTKCYK